MRSFVFFLLMCLLSTPSFAAGLGYDWNGNGIWDDVDNYIERIHPEDGDEKRATLQMVKGLQSLVVDSYSHAETIRNGEQLMRSLECSFYCNQMKAQQIYQALKMAMLNNEERGQKYLEAENRLAGQMFEIGEDPDMWREGCDFSPEYRTVKQKKPPEGGYDGR